MSTRSTEQLLTDFTNAAITYAEKADASDPNGSNRAYKKANAAFETLKDRGEEGRVLDLLSFAHPAVRYSAAAFALRFAPVCGIPVLESLSNGPKGGIAAMAASSLFIWRKSHKTAAA